MGDEIIDFARIEIGADGSPTETPDVRIVPSDPRFADALKRSTALLQNLQLSFIRASAQPRITTILRHPQCSVFTIAIDPA